MTKLLEFRKFSNRQNEQFTKTNNKSKQLLNMYAMYSTNCSETKTTFKPLILSDK